MKNIIMALAVCGTIGLGAAEIDVNGNFAKLDPSAKKPAGWTHTAKNATAVIVNDGKGKNAVKFTLLPGKTWATLRSPCPIPAVSGDTFTITVTASGKGFLSCGAVWTKNRAYAKNMQKRFPLGEKPQTFTYKNTLTDKDVEQGLNGYTPSVILSPAKEGEKDTSAMLYSVKVVKESLH